MQKRKQSVVTLSFEDSNKTARGYYSKLEPKSTPHESAGAISAEGVLLGEHLMELCKEIAGALLCHYSHDGEAQEARRAIHQGLMKTVRCDKFQANCLIDLSLELAHVQSYGKYKRNPLELSLLIAQATGQQRRAIDN